PPQPLVDVVYGETEGNPFFVEEVFQHLAEEGKLFDAKGRWRSDLEVGELDVPEGVRLVIGRRLERVSEECRRVLTAAAVIGRGFSFELLEALGDPSAHSASSGQAGSGQAPSTGPGQTADSDALLDAIDDAERAQLITAAEDGPEARFRFAHELIRQTLISGLSLPRRQRLHLRVAEAMERAYARAPEEHAADLAHHLFQAGAAADPQKTVRYLTLAGEQAFAAAAFEDALRHYEDALSLQPADDRKGHADLLYKRGSALRSLGRWEETLADWREALDVYEEQGDAEAVARVCYQLSEQLGWGANWTEAEEVARRGLAALGEGTSSDRCRLMAQAGFNLVLGGDYEPGSRMLSYAMEMAEELGDPHLLGLVLHSKASIHTWYLQPREAVDPGLRAIELLRSAGDLWNLANTLWNTAYALLSLGRYDEASKMLEEAEPLAERLGHLGALVAIRRGSGFAELILKGDIARYEEFARADLELCRSTDMPWVSNAYRFLGRAHFWGGQWEKALENFEEAARLEPPGMLSGADWAGLFLGKAYAGERDAALAMLDDRRRDLPRSGHANTMGAWMMLLATIEGLAVLGEQDEAAKLYPLALEVIDTGALTAWDFGPPQTYAGMAAAASGRWDEAEEHYETALRQAHDLPAVIAQPEVRRWYARMLLDRDSPGDRDKARELLTEAITMYRHIGLPKHVEMAEVILSEL
ncbi:MAG: tetratricopeptide repeat protein, partial [Dehalococcoidia bacterium]